MTFGIIIVIGFMIIIGITGQFVMHFLGRALVSHDAEVIDPKPNTKY